jgi:hypothetical protein
MSYAQMGGGGGVGGGPLADPRRRSTVGDDSERGDGTNTKYNPDEDDDDEGGRRKGGSGGCGCGAACVWLCKRLWTRQDEDMKDNNANVLSRLTICSLVTLMLLTVVVTLIVASAGLALARNLNAEATTNERVHTYALAASLGSVASGAASANGFLQMDTANRLVTLNLLVYNMPNRTAVHLYGPLEAGTPLGAPVAIPLHDEQRGYSGSVFAPASARITADIRVPDGRDISRVFARPIFYYVGCSTLEAPNGNALRLPLAGEYVDDAIRVFER